MLYALLCVAEQNHVMMSNGSDMKGTCSACNCCKKLDGRLTGGRVSTDKKLNERLYGPGMTAEQILSGRIAPPEELRPLYNAIHRLVVEVGSAPA